LTDPAPSGMTCARIGNHRIASHLHRLLPNSRLHPVPDASHAVHLDAPTEVVALLP